MGIKLEYILIIIIIITVSVTTTVKLTNTSSNHKVMSKELEFKNTVFIEVDQNQTKSKLFSTYGVRDTGVLTLKDVRYNTSNIKELLADKGTYRGNILYLDGNVKLTEKEGFIYTTQHANYQQSNEILTITSPFEAKMAKNLFYGDTLIYLATTKEVNATVLDATVYTVEK